MTPQEQQNLEQRIGRVLRDLPPRSAPSSLERRVQAEIARRAALPWWRKSFAHWPVAARAAFVAASGALIVLTSLGALRALTGGTAGHVKTTLAPAAHGFQFTVDLLAAFVRITASFLGSIPPLWLYGSAALVVGLYVALFGLGAAAYRTLYAPASSS